MVALIKNPTLEQLAIWDALTNRREHIIVQALAGTGKTTTFIEGLRQMGPKPPWAGNRLVSVLFCAFNRSIADELRAKVPGWVDSSTTHALGRRILFDNYDNLEVNEDKTWDYLPTAGRELYDYHKPRDWPRGLRPMVCKLVGYAKNEGVPIPQDPDHVQDHMREWFHNLCDQYGMDEFGHVSELYRLANRVLYWAALDTPQIDFDDMLWLPHVLKDEIDLGRHKRSLVCVDEAQDLNPMQHSLVLSIADRLVVVGDTHQSIYGFRGADVRSMERFNEVLSATERGCITLPLTTCWRCPKTVITLAQRIVPDINAPDWAIDGATPEVSEMDFLTSVKPGDMVLCRTNAPLVQTFYGLVRRKIPAYIQGRKYGAQLIELLENLSQQHHRGGVPQRLHQPAPTDDITTVMQRLSSWYIEQEKRLKREEASGTRMTALTDKYQCLRMILEEKKTIAAALDELVRVFTDTPNQHKVRLSSVHRSKGLEAPRVFILKPEEIPHPMAKKPWEVAQEMNLAYVAVTRAQRELNMVGGTPPAFVIPDADLTTFSDQSLEDYASEEFDDEDRPY